jgi:DNA invertase Pin-like site-specific DNA recombinase
MQTVKNDGIDTQEGNPIDDENETDDLCKGEQKSRFSHLRAKGNSYARIAKELGVSRGTLLNWNTELEAEIARVRSIELEALQEEFFLLKEGRIPLSNSRIRY